MALITFRLTLRCLLREDSIETLHYRLLGRLNHQSRAQTLVFRYVPPENERREELTKRSNEYQFVTIVTNIITEH